MSAMTTALLAEKTPFVQGEADALIETIEGYIAKLKPGKVPAGFTNDAFANLVGPAVIMQVRNPDVTVADMFYDYD
ncbi:MAG: hypothetical protein ACKOPM_03255 [Novosphingobium sp.]